jgi:hypothetical protein
MRNIVLAAGFASGLVAACAGQAGSAQATPPPPSQASAVAPAPHQGHAAHEKHGEDEQGMQGSMGMSCPMKVEGTTVRAADVEGGASLVFTTSGDAAELRKRVHAHADKMASGDCPMMKQGAASH